MPRMMTDFGGGPVGDPNNPLQRESSAPVPISQRVSDAPVPFQGMTQSPAGPVPYQLYQQELHSAPGTGTGAAPGTGGAPAADTPAAAPAGPVQGGRAWYNSLAGDAQKNYQNQFLGGDADYNAQMGEYNRALQDFVARITNQKQGFQTDTTNALTANGKNRDLSLQQLGDDFAARGMSYSGLNDKSRNLLNDRYAQQDNNIQQVGTRNLTDADNRQADFSNQNQIDKGNAQRAALGRMLQQQQLIDSGQTY